MEKWLSSIATLICGLALLSASARADDQGGSRYRFQYAAKFLCTSNIPGTSQTTPSVLPGSYLTVVSIHNPQDQPVQLRKKIAVTFPAEQQQPGPVSHFITERVLADEAFQVDCPQILQNFGIAFIHGAEGFLVIESTHSLDATAIHTAGPSAGQVASIAVEPVRERAIK